MEGKDEGRRKLMRMVARHLEDEFTPRQVLEVAT